MSHSSSARKEKRDMLGRTTYEVCLPDWPAVLPAVGELIGAPDAVSSYLAAESAFEDSQDSNQEWSLQGSTGCVLTVQFEQYEGYLFGVLSGRGVAFNAAAEVLWEAYIAQGGDPEKLEKPVVEPLVMRLPGPLLLVYFAVILSVPYFVATRVHPATGMLLSAIAIWVYVKTRYGGRSFGPKWLEILDLWVILGNAIVFIVSSILTAGLLFA